MVDSKRLNREVSYGGNCAPGGNDSDLGSYFLSGKAERLQTEVKVVRAESISQRHRLH